LIYFVFVIGLVAVIVLVARTVGVAVRVGVSVLAGALVGVGVIVGAGFGMSVLVDVSVGAGVLVSGACIVGVLEAGGSVADATGVIACIAAGASGPGHSFRTLSVLAGLLLTYTRLSVGFSSKPNGPCPTNPLASVTTPYEDRLLVKIRTWLSAVSAMKIFPEH
jgi:hypothetical protein